MLAAVDSIASAKTVAIPSTSMPRGRCMNVSVSIGEGSPQLGVCHQLSEVGHPSANRLPLAALRGKASKQPNVCRNQVVIRVSFHYYRKSAHSSISYVRAVYLVAAIFPPI